MDGRKSLRTEAVTLRTRKAERIAVPSNGEFLQLTWRLIGTGRLALMWSNAYRLPPYGLTNTVLPKISEEFLTRMVEGHSTERVHVCVQEGDFGYDFE